MGAPDALCHALRVIGHVLKRDPDRAVAALAHHAQRIAHQQRVNPCRIRHRRKRRVVGGQHGDLLAAGAHVREGLHVHLLLRSGRYQAVGSRGRRGVLGRIHLWRIHLGDLAFRSIESSWTVCG
ncbi:hypothetical protein D3C71_1506910 [compost metagenome]